MDCQIKNQPLSNPTKRTQEKSKNNPAIESETVQSTKNSVALRFTEISNGRPVSLADGTQRKRRGVLRDIEGETWIGAEMGKFARRVVAGFGEIVECKSGIKFSNTSVTFPRLLVRSKVPRYFLSDYAFVRDTGASFRALALVGRDGDSPNLQRYRVQRQTSVSLAPRGDLQEKYIHTYTPGANRYTR